MTPSSPRSTLFPYTTLFRSIQSLRYGENPHQNAAFYATPDKRLGVATARQLQGRELSYNNINDTDAAYECIAEFEDRKSTRLNSSHANISYAVFCLKKKRKK